MQACYLKSGMIFRIGGEEYRAAGVEQTSVHVYVYGRRRTDIGEVYAGLLLLGTAEVEVVSYAN